MVWPVPSQYGISTPYNKKGSHWSCDEDANGDGRHTGVDMACPSGTPLYASIDGQIRHRNYGSAFGSHQFAISPDPGQPFEDGEVYYAHARKRLSDGVYVHAGDWVGEAGAEGNVTGPHLHYEYHPHHKNKWNCDVHADPAPTLGLVASGGPYITEHVYRSKCGYGEPTNGDDSSDTVKELQERLNRISLEGGAELPVTGKYHDMTDAEVRKWQEQVCGDNPDPEGQSYLGPNQFAAMFPDSVYTLHDDGDPAIASGSAGEGETGSGTTLGQWLKAQGFTVHDDDVPLGRESEWRGVDFLMVHHTGGSSDDTKNPADLAEYIRFDGDDPPLAQIFLDKNGEVWITCRERGDQPDPGRASHAGYGSGFGVPDDSMNPRCLGIECQCNGSHALSTHSTMYSVLLGLLAALRDRYGVPKDNVIGHKEWSSTGKTDPRDDMDILRAEVDAVLNPPEEIEVPPEPEEPGDEEETLISTFGLTKWFSGKETNAILVHPDGEWHKICKEMPPTGIMEESSEIKFLYLRILLPSGRTATRTIETHWRRSNGDETAYKGPAWDKDAKDSIAYENMHLEDGSGLGGQWYIKVTGGTDPIEVTTRYAKTHIYFQDEVTVLVGQAMHAGGEAIQALIRLLKGLS